VYSATWGGGGEGCTAVYIGTKVPRPLSVPADKLRKAKLRAIEKLTAVITGAIFFLGFEFLVKEPQCVLRRK
jgi:hypothetical protein